MLEKAVPALINYCFEFFMQSTTHLTVRCSVHPPQYNSTRKAAVCLHFFIPICADAKRPNGWLVWKVLFLLADSIRGCIRWLKLWLCNVFRFGDKSMISIAVLLKTEGDCERFMMKVFVSSQRQLNMQWHLWLEMERLPWLMMQFVKYKNIVVGICASSGLICV